MKTVVMKKVAQALAALMIVSMLSPVLAFAAFDDLSSHWAKKDIEALVEQKIVDGVTPTQFEPERSITRAEFAALVVRSLGLTSVTSSTYFNDVDASDWYADTVSTATYAGLINGYEDNSFRPAAPVTREEMAAIVIRALTYADVATIVPADTQKELLAQFKDSDQIVWAHKEIAAALNAKIINGMTADTFNPAGTATRAQAAAVVNRYLPYTK
ncbi:MULTISPECIES: S-layer homology domain-containing protein [Paenibacillus]|uniref:S-layer protein n=1 Tax=Paenibacillus naphthalenovorans TaxID=162209 RepID=A0A0U2UM45_9BACL|nr:MULTISPECIES: S-layer homology domain-containing protein [Paenibacillus]ALS24172.1 S-layer protein [Paenibacillus naphthalenovorans]SDJ85145.1 S-layer homology domain-containing protein [Paenibacillus naphthalenovorans]